MYCVCVCVCVKTTHGRAIVMMARLLLLLVHLVLPAGCTVPRRTYVKTSSNFVLARTSFFLSSYHGSTRPRVVPRRTPTTAIFIGLHTQRSARSAPRRRRLAHNRLQTHVVRAVVHYTGVARPARRSRARRAKRSVRGFFVRPCNSDRSEGPQPTRAYALLSYRPTECQLPIGFIKQGSWLRASCQHMLWERVEQDVHPRSMDHHELPAPVDPAAECRRRSKIDSSPAPKQGEPRSVGRLSPQPASGCSASRAAATRTAQRGVSKRNPSRCARHPAPTGCLRAPTACRSGNCWAAARAV